MPLPTKTLLSFAAATTLSACCTNGLTDVKANPNSSEVVRVDEVIESVKCGVGTFLIYAQKNPEERFPVTTGQAVLTLRDVGISSNVAGGGLVVPVAGFSLGPSVQVTNTLTDTNTTVFTLKFVDIELSDAAVDDAVDDVSDICSSKADDTESYLTKNGTHPIAEALKSFQESTRNIQTGYPLMKSDKLVLTTQLDIANSKEAGFELGFSVVNAEGTQTTTNSSRQILQLTFETPKAGPFVH